MGAMIMITMMIAATKSADTMFGITIAVTMTSIGAMIATVTGIMAIGVASVRQDRR